MGRYFLSFRMNLHKQVTLQDIADQAKVTRACVSMALRNHKEISKKTCLRIQEIAKKLRYTPHPLISTLMSYHRASKPLQQHQSLGFILNLSEKESMSTLFSPDLLHSAIERASHYGYRLETFYLRSPGMTGSRLSKILYSRNIPGILIPPSRQHAVTFNWIGVSFLQSRSAIH